MKKKENSIFQDFLNGNEKYAYKIFGAHKAKEKGQPGFRFTAWAPGALKVDVVGDYNDWREDNAWHMDPIGRTGCWSIFIPGVTEGQKYKYLVYTDNGLKLYKADPYAFRGEIRPGTASVTHTFNYKWHDSRWLKKRAVSSHFNQPKNIYEVHLGSWKRHLPGEEGYTEGGPGDEGDGVGTYYSYRELAETLVPYAKEMGYTHLEILPVMEHPFDGSWGYQLTGYFAATSRFGTPEDLMYLIDRAHKEGIGIILDWVPGHFCRDSHGLGMWNGHMLYEKRDHKQWGTYIFDYGRKEVQSFLMSNLVFWLEEFHADGIRVDGVTSMLYLNFGIDDPEEKIFNDEGTEENKNAIALIRRLNALVGTDFPGVFTVAEESTAWPLVTAPPDAGGLGFHYKWDMGWMNDTLTYMKTDFPYRSADYDKITFSMMYAFNENFVLPLSHDEVVHGKCSIIGRQPGDDWRKFAGARLLALYQMTHPGGKLNFMGNEFVQFIEWRYYEQLEWFMMNFDNHRKHHDFIKALNNLYLKDPALYSDDHSWEGFRWIDADNRDQCMLSYIRTSADKKKMDIVVLNFGVMAYGKYTIGVPKKGTYREVLSTDDTAFAGSGCINEKSIKAKAKPYHGMPYSIEIKIPPVGGTIIRYTGRTEDN
ncbi:MAG: 1,4-alpha-glucan branching protein GlgB [Parasporobacterium sp.]|nr:1,4-alpha-glucan branching protein GlgB [Parasporobacterium sp.]